MSVVRVLANHLRLVESRLAQLVYQLALSQLLVQLFHLVVAQVLLHGNVQSVV